MLLERVRMNSNTLNEPIDVSADRLVVGRTNSKPVRLKVWFSARDMNVRVWLTATGCSRSGGSVSDLFVASCGGPGFPCGVLSCPRSRLRALRLRASAASQTAPDFRSCGRFSPPQYRTSRSLRACFLEWVDPVAGSPRPSSRRSRPLHSGRFLGFPIGPSQTKQSSHVNPTTLVSSEFPL